MTTLIKNMPVRTLWRAHALRDAALGLLLAFAVLFGFATLLFTAPALGAMGVDTTISRYFWSAMTEAELRDMVFWVTPELGLSFTPDEASHLADVKALLHAGVLAAGACLLTVMAGMLLRPNWRRITAIAFGAVGALTVVCLLVWALGGFKLLSDGFHTVLFPAGNWSFAPHQLMIQLYPPALMQLGMILWLGVSLLITGTLALICWHGKRG